MKTNSRTMLLALAACVPCLAVLAAKPGSYYTTANIWYEHPEKIYSTNYHAGRIIPAGSEVEVLSAKGRRVKFRVKGKKTEFLSRMARLPQLNSNYVGRNRWMWKRSKE